LLQQSYIGKLQGTVTESDERVHIAPQVEMRNNVVEQPHIYRADIDGLRAIAVVAVVLHHWSADVLPGGFIGVDIFFVISGYLITGIIRREKEFSFSTFYQRRITRIFPALAVMLVCVTILCSFLLVGEARKNFALSVNWSVLSFSNVYIFAFLPSGYFDAPMQLEPLLHLW
jgi:peptidoglycan/LPS O-acetylase OafA/YrhL